MARSSRTYSSNDDESEVSPSKEPESYNTGQEYSMELDGEPSHSKSKSKSRTERTGPFAKEVTRIAPDDSTSPQQDDSPDATRVGPPRRLDIVLGPDAGTSLRLRTVRVVIGRTAGCELKLNDPSVSRRHVELIQTATGVLLRDLGSGNGTKVNGELASEKILQNEDEISLGKTRIRFIDEKDALEKIRQQAEEQERQSQAPEKIKSESTIEGIVDEEDAQNTAEANALHTQSRVTHAKGTETVAARVGHWRNWMSTHAVNLIRAGVLAAVFSGALFFWKRTKTSLPPDPKVIAASKKMAKAQQAYEADQYAQAMEWVEAAKRLNPQADSEGLFAKARQEMETEHALEVAKAALAQNQLEDARKFLASIRQPNAEHLKDLRSLQGQISDREVDMLKRIVENALELRKFDVAAEVIARMVPESQPTYREKLKAARLKYEQDLLHQKAATDQARRNEHQRQKVRRHDEMEETFAGVEKKFYAGDYDRAVIECERVLDEHRLDVEVKARANELRRAIPEFKRAYDEAERKYQAGAIDSAAKPLQLALNLYHRIGFVSPAGATLSQQFTTVLLNTAKASIDRNDLSSSAAAYREVLQLNPAEGRAKEGMLRLSRRAEQLWVEAYMIRDRNPKESAAKLKLIIDITAEDNPTHQKARAQLDK